MLLAPYKPSLLVGRGYPQFTTIIIYHYQHYHYLNDLYKGAAVLLVWMVACGKRSTNSKGTLGVQEVSSIGPHGSPENGGKVVCSEEEKFLTLEVIKFL